MRKIRLETVGVFYNFIGIEKVRQEGRLFTVNRLQESLLFFTCTSLFFASTITAITQILTISTGAHPFKQGMPRRPNGVVKANCPS